MRPYTSAAYMVQLGRQFQIHGVLKRAFYELVSSPAFWEVLFETREQIRLSEADFVLRLVEIRVALGTVLREFVQEVPPTKQSRRGYSWECCNAGGRQWAKALREVGSLVVIASHGSQASRMNNAGGRTAWLPSAHATRLSESMMHWRVLIAGALRWS